MFPLIFGLGKNLGGGMMPSILAGQASIAYTEDNLIYVLPIGGQLYQPIGNYFKATISTTLKKYVQEELKATWVKRLNYKAGDKEPQDQVYRDKQELFVLLEKLSKLFLTIEPNPIGLRAHGIKIRELHLLACMEVENYLREFYMQADPRANPKNLSTRDYIKLKVDLSRFSSASLSRLTHFSFKVCR